MHIKRYINAYYVYKCAHFVWWLLNKCNNVFFFISRTTTKLPPALMAFFVFGWRSSGRNVQATIPETLP